MLAVIANTAAAGHGGTPPLSPAALPDLLRASGGQLVDGAVPLAWIVLSAGEFRHHTSVTTFLGQPRRLRVVSAKLAAAALTGAAVGLLAETLSAATLSAHHVPLAWDQPGVSGALVAVPLLAALYGVLGAGLGLVLRNTAAAVGLALTWAFVVEGMVPALIHQPGISRWPPEAAADAAPHGASPTALPAGMALAVLACYAAVLAGAGTGAAVTARREITTAPG